LKMASTPLQKPIEIFYPGRHVASDGRKLTFSAEQVAQWAAGGQRIPLVPGHPKNDKPVMGWATGFSFSGNRLKITETEDVDPSFEQIVNSKQLNRVSVKLRPVGEGWALGHIGFLGVSPPSLEGLAAAEFSNETSADGGIWFMADEQDLDLAKRELELEDRKAEFAAEQAAFAAKVKWTPVVSKLVTEGKVLPVEEAPLVALFSKLDDGEAIEFSRGEKDEAAQPAEFLATLLGRAKPVVNYTEFSAAKGAKANADGPAFAMKGGKGMVDDEDAEMHDAIVASGVDPKDHNAYAAAVKKYAKEGC
jgi:hypothetical protein